MTGIVYEQSTVRSTKCKDNEEIITLMMKSGWDWAQIMDNQRMAIWNGEAPNQVDIPKIEGLEFLNEGESGTPRAIMNFAQGGSSSSSSSGGKKGMTPSNKGGKGNGPSPNGKGKGGGFGGGGGEHSMSDTFEVPKKYLGLLIGKAGDSIRKMREEASKKGVKIFVDQVDKDSGGDVKVTGNDWMSIQEIKNWLQQNLFKAIANIDIQDGRQSATTPTSKGGTPRGKNNFNGGGKGGGGNSPFNNNNFNNNGNNGNNKGFNNGFGGNNMGGNNMGKGNNKGNNGFNNGFNNNNNNGFNNNNGKGGNNGFGNNNNNNNANTNDANWWADVLGGVLNQGNSW